MEISLHCKIRSCQRSISARQISIVLDYGLFSKHKNDIIYYMSNKNIRIALEIGAVEKQEADKLKNIFVVLDKSNQVVTTYRPNKKKLKRIISMLA